MWIVGGIACALVLGLYWWYLSYPKAKDVGTIPDMPGRCWPLVGHMPTILGWPENSHLRIHDTMLRELGTYSYLIYAPGIPLRTIVLTVDPGS